MYEEDIANEPRTVNESEQVKHHDESSLNIHRLPKETDKTLQPTDRNAGMGYITTKS
jgi:hypothetical protein